MIMDPFHGMGGGGGLALWIHMCVCVGDAAVCVCVDPCFSTRNGARGWGPTIYFR